VRGIGLDPTRRVADPGPVRGLAVMGAVIAVGCFSPAPQPGGACAEDGRCPEPLVCDDATDTCVAVEDPGDDAGDDTSGDDAGDPPDGGGGPPVNDAPADAIDVSGGGTFTVDLTMATDDGDGSCGEPGGRDAFFELTTDGPEVIYVDSVGSDFDAVIVVLDGPCDSDADEVACLDDECELQAQGAGEVAGTICLVVEQALGTGEAAGHAVVTVVRGDRPGTELPAAEGMIVGSTLGADNATTPECDGDESTAGDVGYFFTACPGEMLDVYADTCAATPYDSWLSIRAGSGVAGAELECQDDERRCGPDGDDAVVFDTVTGPGLFWILVDGWADERGEYTLTYAIGAP
jgi:hypothetical protein